MKKLSSASFVIEKSLQSADYRGSKTDSMLVVTETLGHFIFQIKLTIIRNFV